MNENESPLFRGVLSSEAVKQLEAGCTCVYKCCEAITLSVQPMSLLFLCHSSPDSTQPALSTGGTGGGEVVGPGVGIGPVGPGALAGNATDKTGGNQEAVLNSLGAVYSCHQPLP